MFDVDKAVQQILEGCSILDVLTEAQIIPFNDLRAELVTNFTTDVDPEPLKVISTKADWDNRGVIEFTSSDLGILSGEVNDVIKAAGYDTTVALTGSNREKDIREYKFRRIA